MYRKIKGWAIPSLCVLVSLMFGPSSAAAQGGGLKLFGAYGSISGGDLYDGLKGPIDYYKQLFDSAGFGLSGDFKSFRSSWEAGGDFIFYFTPVMGVGFGASYLQTLPAKTSLTITDPPHPDATMDLAPKVTVIPVRASLYASVPMAAGLNLSFHAGVSYYFAKAEFTWRLEQTPSFQQLVVKAKGQGVGFHGGLGLEFKFSPSAALVLEAAGRVARISGFTGDAAATSSGGGSSSISGTLYYLKYDYGLLGIHPEVGISETEPSDPHYSDVREAVVDLSGFSLRAGFLFRF